MFSTPFMICGILFATCGIVASSVAMFRIVKAFDLIKVIFFLVFLDCLSTLVCTSMVTVLLFILLSHSEIDVTCKVLFVAIYLITYLGGIITALIAGLRCLTLAHGSLEREPTNRAVAGFCLLSLGVCVPSVYFGYCVKNSESFGFIDDACREHGDNIGPNQGQSIFIGLSQALLPIVSLILDIVLIKKTNRTAPIPSIASHNTTSESNKNKIPVQATILSAVLIACNILFWVVKFLMEVSGVDLETVGGVVLLFFCIFAPIRAPLTLVCTFAVMKAENRKTAMELKRLERQERVRRHAWRNLKRQRMVDLVV